MGETGGATSTGAGRRVTQTDAGATPRSSLGPAAASNPFISASVTTLARFDSTTLPIWLNNEKYAINAST